LGSPDLIGLQKILAGSTDVQDVNIPVNDCEQCTINEAVTRFEEDLSKLEVDKLVLPTISWLTWRGV
jgi:hypothetical protein